MRTKRLSAIIPASIALTLSACSEHGPSSQHKKTPAVPSISSGPAIHAYARIQGVQRRIDFGPPTIPSDAQVGSAQQSLTANSPRLEGAQHVGRPTSKSASDVRHTEQALTTDASAPSPVGQFDLGDDFPTGPADSFQLVRLAAVECGARYDYKGCHTGQQNDCIRYTPADSNPLADVDGAHPAWYPGNLFVFNGVPETCEQALAYQDVLLCTADKLAEVADNVGTLTWSNIPTQLGGTISFPPQADRDKFIARDLARLSLATMALVDQVPVTLASMYPTCIGGYGEVLGGDQSLWVPVLSYAYRELVYEPKLAVTANNVPALVDGRLRYKAGLYRSAGRLLKTLIEKSVDADLAATEQKRAQATDPLEANEIAWGRQDGPYGSLEHAGFVVLGRLELLASDPGYGTLSPWSQIGKAPDYRHAPVCRGQLPLQPSFMPTQYGPDLEARINDLPIRTAGQQLAADVWDGSGIVLNRNFTSGSSVDMVREALTGQLIVNAAVSAGLPPDDPNFPEGDRAQVLTKLVEGISDQDLLFAARRAFGHWQMLAATDLDSPDSGFALPEAPKPPNALFGGIAIAGGIPNADLTVDFTARAAGLFSAAQCRLEHPADPVFYFQDSFALAHGLATAENWIRGMGGVTTGPDSVDEIATEGQTELRTWAGSGSIYLWPTSTDNGELVLPVDIVDATPEELGIEDAEPSEQAIASSFRFAYGPPWVADCAAKLRSACPTDIADYVGLPTGPVEVTYEHGVIHAMFYTAVIDGLVGTKFRPEYVHESAEDPTPSSYGRSYLYLISQYDPSKPGKVLGPLTLQSHRSFVMIPLSNYQRQLINRIFGVPPSYVTDGTDVGHNSTAPSGGYCLPGVPRDLFVPLENELTSDSDQYENSWKHYLTLAQQAAQQADAMGQKLIEVGTQREYRREAAQEALAAECGDYAAAAKVTISSDAQVVAPDDDATLGLCLNEKNTDIVFLTDDLLDSTKLGAEQRSAKLRAILSCSGTGASNPLCSRANVTSDALHMAGAKPSGGAGSTGAVSCGEVVGLVPSLTSSSGLNASPLRSAAAQAWASATGIYSALLGVRFIINDDATWTLVSNGTTLMNSKQPATNERPVWPGCKLNASCNSSGSDFDSIFLPPDKRGSSTLTRSDMNDIAWRVEGALSTLGIPANLFSIPVPVADFTTFNTTDMPMAALYGTAHLVPATDGSGTYRLDWVNYPGMTSEDGNILSPIIDVAADFAIRSSVGDRPSWVHDLYSRTTFPFRHVRGTNVGVNRGGDLGPFSELAGNLQGARCERFWGTPQGAASIGKAISALGNRMDGTHKLCRNLRGDAYFQFGSGTFGVGRISRTDYSEENALLWDRWVLAGEDSPCGKPGYADPAERSEVMPGLSNWSRYGYEGPTTGCSDHTGLNACAEGIWVAPSCTMDRLGDTARALSPTYCGPDQRVPAWINAHAAQDGCDAAARILQAVALACKLSESGAGDASVTLPPPPSLRSVEDIDALEQWIRQGAAHARAELNGLYLENVPQRAVEDFKTQKVGTGALSGNHGTKVLEIESGLNSVWASWQNVIGYAEQIASLVRASKTEIAGARLDAKAKSIQNAMAAEQIAMSRMQAIQSVMSSCFALISSAVLSGGALGLGEVAKTAAGISSAASELAHYDRLESLQKELASTQQAQGENAIHAVLDRLDANIQPIFTNMKTELARIRSGIAQVQGAIVQLNQSEANARYEAAKTAGVDFYRDASGQVVTLPLNTVLRREYDITKLRYERSLADAKYLAYVARLAIEQRIGSRLNTITTAVGPLTPPAQWADDVCSLQGVDYDQLRQVALPDDAGTWVASEEDEKQLISEFADQYIGDYVTKLANFVEYYNIQYPSHDGDDTAVLSLRDDLLTPDTACLADSPNLLYYSADLTASSMVDVNGVATRFGWKTLPCAVYDSQCLVVSRDRAVPGSALPLPATPGVATGVSWLHEVPPPAPSESGTGGAGGAAPSSGGSSSTLDTTGAAPPTRIVYQELHLAPGTYVLSWWDQGRAADGGFATAPASSYSVAIYDQDWTQVKSQKQDPFMPTIGPDGSVAGASWSDRRVLEFQVSKDGNYFVAFNASAAPGSPASVLISNPQLEFTSRPGADPSAYIGTGSSRQYVASDCTTRTAADVQSAFLRNCGSQGCYYELAKPILIDTSALATGGSRFSGKLAAGNFNFRHITVAVNLVGTGVHGCDRDTTGSCYSSGYLEYDLSHDAFDLSMAGWNGELQSFNFGSASINHGKALSAERFVTVPIGSADQQLLSQPSIQKPEFRGRPLDGSYRLRIWESPSLNWNRLEDVQVILNYRYWSAIQPQAGTD